jgi:hypothetical protein
MQSTEILLQVCASQITGIPKRMPGGVVGLVVLRGRRPFLNSQVPSNELSADVAVSLSSTAGSSQSQMRCYFSPLHP